LFRIRESLWQLMQNTTLRSLIRPRTLPEALPALTATKAAL
jgi:hypothetical protein